MSVKLYTCISPSIRIIFNLKAIIMVFLNCTAHILFLQFFREKYTSIINKERDLFQRYIIIGTWVHIT